MNRTNTKAIDINPKWILPLFSFQWGWGRSIKNYRFSYGRQQTQSLYYNGIIFIRLMLPFYIGLMVRWSGSTNKIAFLQTHVGWKLNGNAAITFRLQSDDSGRISNVGPAFDNHGQAVGWNDGPK